MQLRMTISSQSLAVREALQSVMEYLRANKLTDGDTGMVELVLAEVMNNVVEHAYNDASDGTIELSVCGSQHGIECKVVDFGKAMPNGTVPAGLVQDPDGPIDALPEGGFGWSLIHSLTENLTYAHNGFQNELRFQIGFGEA